jgi:hypothetical protein
MSSSSTVEQVRGTGVDRFEQWLRWQVNPLEQVLWLVVLTSFTADVVLTFYGLRHGLREANPLLRAAFEGAGFAMLGLVKVLALGIAGLVREAFPRHRTVIPVAVALPWVCAVVVNLVMLAPLLV